MRRQGRRRPTLVVRALAVAGRAAGAPGEVQHDVGGVSRDTTCSGTPGSQQVVRRVVDGDRLEVARARRPRRWCCRSGPVAAGDQERGWPRRSRPVLVGDRRSPLRGHSMSSVGSSHRRVRACVGRVQSVDQVHHARSRRRASGSRGRPPAGPTAVPGLDPRQLAPPPSRRTSAARVAGRPARRTTAPATHHTSFASTYGADLVVQARGACPPDGCATSRRWSAASAAASGRRRESTFAKWPRSSSWTGRSAGGRRDARRPRPSRHRAICGNGHPRHCASGTPARGRAAVISAAMFHGSMQDVARGCTSARPVGRQHRDAASRAGTCPASRRCRRPRTRDVVAGAAGRVQQGVALGGGAVRRHPAPAAALLVQPGAQAVDGCPAGRPEGLPHLRVEQSAARLAPPAVVVDRRLDRPARAAPIQ